MENKREIFERIVRDNIKREGIDDLMEWLDETDFYTAPASTKYHGAEEGGLLEHSLEVYYALERLSQWYERKIPFNNEAIAIVALFHDLCKVNFYKQVDGQWKHNEQLKYGGHGSKSVYLIMKHMDLTDIEASAINAHMGAWDLSTYNNPGMVYSWNPLAWLLHVADEEDTYLTKIT